MGNCGLKVVLMGLEEEACLTILLTRLMILLAMLRWKPDFMIGLQSPTTAFKGLAAIREGYTCIWINRSISMAFKKNP